MKATHEPEVPPDEFMEEYTRVNNNYKDDMLAMKKYIFLRYTEPTIAEEEAMAQILGRLGNETTFYYTPTFFCVFVFLCMNFY